MLPVWCISVPTGRFLIPDLPRRLVAVEHFGWTALIDVAGQPAIDPESAEFAKLWGEGRHDVRRDSKLDVFLLPNEPGAVIHCNTDPGFICCCVRSPAMPQTSMPNEHAAFRHFSRNGLNVGLTVSVVGVAMMFPVAQSMTTPPGPSDVGSQMGELEMGG